MQETKENDIKCFLLEKIIKSKYIFLGFLYKSNIEHTVSDGGKNKSTFHLYLKKYYQWFSFNQFTRKK